ncbi:ABC transporter ATP-binding protein [Pseudonocardia sp. WMMC193]|uniref:ABC transporter ATP-binding protein n=1 Tax=Pseudonocardia sp. WMMC193 TaxID=2911965 RepID=UPI001EFF7AC9|nr:ATP-binding cassette domain-containing protein [Pseudonocardia sp. WMMC193]MCF7550744.1 ATP-binding cassette domain-containing protein [Pseudonocardia sp. WMMC193]
MTGDGDAGPPAVRFDDITVRFGDEPVLRRLRGEFPAGELTVLMGESGGGKTTLMRHLVGLRKPDSGSIEVGGRVVHTLDKRGLTALRGSMGVLLGGATLFDSSVFGSLTVYENVAYPLRLRVDDDETVHATVCRWLGTLGLADAHDRLPEQLPAHTRRRVALARALAPEPPLIVLDDIDLGLDSTTVARAVAAVRDVHARRGSTVVVTTHDIELARALGGRLAVLAHGRLVANGPVAELLDGVRDAADFDDRFRVRDSLGPMDIPAPPAGRRWTVAVDPRLVAILVAGLVLVTALVIAVRLSGAG